VGAAERDCETVVTTTTTTTTTTTVGRLILTD
jgi:hypothetical protein